MHPFESFAALSTIGSAIRTGWAAQESVTARHL